jgi:ABC-2 type transport system permease protein
VSVRRTLATARRVLLQLRHDPRTIALLLVVPVLLLVLLRYVYDAEQDVFQHIGGPLLGIFPFVVMFVVTSIATLRERTSGTLERLLTMPMAKLDLLAGYAVAFGLLAIVQSLIVSLVALGPLGLNVSGSSIWLVVVAVLDGLLGMALGLFVSAFATSEFQAVQFMPAFVLPQLLLCGLFVARSQMAPLLRWISDVLPLSYAVDAMHRVTSGSTSGLFARDVVIVAGSSVVALMLGAATLRRRTP